MIHIKRQIVFDLQGKKIWIAGHSGMVGQALIRHLEREPGETGAELLTPTHAELDLTRQAAVEEWARAARPDALFMLAGKVGGIAASRGAPADFLYENLIMTTNVIHAAYRCGVPKMLFVGSASVYPTAAPQPMAEEALLTGPLEPANQWYALAKIAGQKLCEAYRKEHGCDFITIIPTNMYGPGDRFDPHQSHVIPALMRRFHNAKMDGAASLKIWGDGTPRREFLFVDDCADALVHFMKKYSAAAPLNIGVGGDISILDLARIIARVVGFAGEIRTDPGMPGGTAQRLLDSSAAQAHGWSHKTGLKDGLEETYRWFLEHAT